MPTRPARRSPARIAPRSVVLLLATFAVALPAAATRAQDRLKTMPGYERYQQVAKEIPGSVRLGMLSTSWADSGKTLLYQMDGKRYRYSVEARKAAQDTATDARQQGSGLGGRGRAGSAPARGRQVDAALSPDGKRRAFYRDRNLWLGDSAGANAVAITTDGSETARVKYGTASWVYGEELDQTTAIWWSPRGDKVAYYRFDESPVPDYYLQLDQTKLQSTVDTEAYPKAGVPNPVVDLFVYDVATQKSVKLDVRDGKPFANDVVGHYAYHVGWTPDGSELTFNRANRRQNIVELTACSPETGKCRGIVREEWPASWVTNSPTMQYLNDGKRFIWASERTGFRNYYLYDLTGKLLAPLTSHRFEVGNIVQVDEKAGVLWYMARDGDNYMKMQLHRVGLTGKGDRRLTDPAFNHTVSLAPNGRTFVDVAQTHDTPPVTRLMAAEGKLISELAKSDMTKFGQLGLKPVELFTFKAADGATELHGMLHRPSNFDPAKKYPVLVTVYAGPATNGARETFTAPSALTEYGFLVLSLDARSAGGRGKRFLDAIYEKLGQTEIDDLAAGVKALWDRPYVAKDRVGIYGTSYGGYASAMALFRYPDVFAAASASSPVTDWRHYDTIYTERYMWLPQENKAGYDAGSTITHAPKLKGRLMLYYGTADNNVHPSNMMQLVQALQQAGKSFELQVGPDRGHSGINQDRMMEFFIENLVMKSAATSATF
ncbi:MAG: DPP IV N-terminal domain-containing protein [Gemmatimonadaceae bacterium]